VQNQVHLQELAEQAIRDVEQAGDLRAVIRAALHQ